MVEFEFDPATSQANRIKHGISFVDAQLLWADPARVEIPARTVNEPRWLVVSQIGGKCWSAVVAHRDRKVRIISVRRAPRTTLRRRGARARSSAGSTSTSRHG